MTNKYSHANNYSNEHLRHSADTRPDECDGRLTTLLTDDLNDDDFDKTFNCLITLAKYDPSLRKTAVEIMKIKELRDDDQMYAVVVKGLYESHFISEDKFRWLMSNAVLEAREFFRRLLSNYDT